MPGGEEPRTQELGWSCGVSGALAWMAPGLGLDPAQVYVQERPREKTSEATRGQGYTRLHLRAAKGAGTGVLERLEGLCCCAAKGTAAIAR